MNRESMVLLKNANNLLPLDKKQMKNILVTGPLAGNQLCYQLWTITQPGYQCAGWN
jgi:beta-glucosidase-like glycosyl hydrolase